MARRWQATLQVAVAGSWLIGGCLYRVTPPPGADAPASPHAGPAPTAAAAPSERPTVNPWPTIGQVVAASPTVGPVVLPSPPADIREVPPSPDAGAGPAAETELSPIPTLAPVTPVIHRFTLGESLNGVVATFLNDRLKRRVTEDEVRAAVRILLDDPANAPFRDRPSLVRPDQVLTLTPLITYTESLPAANAPR